MNRKSYFNCKSCGARVELSGAGSAHRNHCPYCLCSLHLDSEPGDRAADCGGIMEPVGVWGAQGRRVGDNPSMPPLRCIKLQQDRGGRRSAEADEHCG